MSPHPPLASGRQAAFSLVELLVAMAILALILVLLLQISGSTLQATRISRQQLEAGQQTRIALDSLAADLGNVVLEHDLPLFIAQDEEGNTRLAFLARGRGPNVSGQAPSRFLAVSYELEDTTLVKRLAPVTWTNADLMDAVLDAVSAPDTVELADGVLRFEAVALLHDGSVVNLSAGGNWKTTTIQGQTIPEPFAGLVLGGDSSQRVRSLIIGVAAIDKQNLRLQGTAEIAQKLSSPQPGQTPLEAWNKDLSSGALDGVPMQALAALRFEQRSYLLK